MTLQMNEIVLHLDAVRATEAFVCTRVAPGRYVVTDAIGWGPDVVSLDDEPLAAAAVRDGIRRTASPDARRVVAGYKARSAALIAFGIDTLVIIGRRDGCMAGVNDEELIATALAVLNATS